MEDAQTAGRGWEGETNFFLDQNSPQVSGGRSESFTPLLSNLRKNTMC